MKLVRIRYNQLSVLDLIYLGTGEDENEGESPSKKAKGKAGRKAAPKSKTATNKDVEHEAENGNH
jgi:hypothetical protein